MRYYFGRSSVDTSSREITLDGIPTHLSPKAFELLRHLIETRPRVVPKNELMQRLWPDTFVGEANLAVLVGEVRAAIGDTGTAQTIRTHHRVGYGFAAVVREAPSGGDRNRSQGLPRVVLVLQGRQATLQPGTTIVGRDREAGLPIDDASVSRRHARLVVEGDAVTVEDLGSRNGTRIHGVAVTEPTVMVKGDVVAFGAVEARLDVHPFDDSATKPL